MSDTLAGIERPNGKRYRPRKLSAYAVTDYDDNLAGVVVFGTHEITDRVRKLAEDYVAWQMDSGFVPVDPSPVWWRDGFEWGQRRWLDDPVRGRAGVWFREIVERSR